MINNEREFEEFKVNLNNIMDKNDTSSKNEIINMNINLNKFNENNEKDIKRINEDMSHVATKLQEVNDQLSRLERTENKIKMNSNKNNIKCPICELQFTTNTDMETHIRTVHKENLFQCDKCEGIFQTEWRLKKHQSNHSKMKPRRNCHYFNSHKKCPFEVLGCKFLHKLSKKCSFGRHCARNMCQFRHDC